MAIPHGAVGCSAVNVMVVFPDHTHFFIYYSKCKEHIQ